MHPRLRIGLEELFASTASAYEGARAGLICNPASVDGQFNHALDLFGASPRFQLKRGFGPQHGVRGDKQDNMIESEDFYSSRLGIPISSLYGRTRKPTPGMLAELDILFCDLADVGTRIYTYVTTMALAMEACAEAGKKFVVLDRPNPIGGSQLEGNLLDPQFRSFVGCYPIPMRHGLTMGELARLFNEEFGVGVDLDVVPMAGWSRAQWLDDTGLSWVMPSPNMPSLETATVYPGMVLMEGTMLSEGRGTTRPFELVGAPYIDPDTLALHLNGLRLPGVFFRPTYFQPVDQKWENQLCGGVQLHVTDREIFRPYRSGLAILKSCLELYRNQFQWRQPPYEYEYEKLPIDILAGTDRVRIGLEQGRELSSLEESWRAELDRFRAMREKYLIYS